MHVAYNLELVLPNLHTKKCLCDGTKIPRHENVHCTIVYNWEKLGGKI